MGADPIDESGAFVSTIPAGSRDRRLALGVVAVSGAIFLAVAPFAKVPLAPVWAFIPIYQTTLVVNDLTTAVLLFGQYAILRTRALLVLAAGYLFTAGMAGVHTLSFPGLFAPTGLLGAGPQTTAWLYMFWHAGFPLCVVAYALLKPGGLVTGRAAGGHPAAAILSCVAAALAAVGGLALLATRGQDALPAIMAGHHYTPAMIGVVSSVWALSLLALWALWRRRPHSVLDLWLVVVLCVWLFDVALSAVLNQGRFDLGFYAGRIYGLLAASFVLGVLLIEHALLYARLAAAHESERRERRLVQPRTAELTAANRDLEAFSYSVSHDLRAPLRSVDGFARALEEDFGDRLDGEARRLLGIIQQSVRKMDHLIEDLLAFARLGRQALERAPVPLETLVRRTMDEVRPLDADRRIEFTVGALGTADADSGLLQQALTNLLSNAVKFTRRRDTARIEVGRRGDVYYVRDNGAGFDMRHADKLFRVFHRLHPADEYEGTGVGLAIVQRVIERHGGRIWAESTFGEGATFYFTLRPDAPGAAVSESGDASQERVSG
jgi:signal transduction histidine kinase